MITPVPRGGHGFRWRAVELRGRLAVHGRRSFGAVKRDRLRGAGISRLGMIDGELCLPSELRHQLALSRRASALVRQVVHAQAGRDFAQALSTGREKSAQQPALAQLFQPRPPAFGAAVEPISERRAIADSRWQRAMADRSPRSLACSHRPPLMIG